MARTILILTLLSMFSRVFLIAQTLICNDSSYVKEIEIKLVGYDKYGEPIQVRIEGKTSYTDLATPLKNSDGSSAYRWLLELPVVTRLEDFQLEPLISNMQSTLQDHPYVSSRGGNCVGVFIFALERTWRAEISSAPNPVTIKTVDAPPDSGPTTIVTRARKTTEEIRMQIKLTQEDSYPFELSFSLFGSTKTITHDATEISKLVWEEKKSIWTNDKAVIKSRIMKKVQNIAFRLIEP